MTGTFLHQHERAKGRPGYLHLPGEDHRLHRATRARRRAMKTRLPVLFPFPHRGRIAVFIAPDEMAPLPRTLASALPASWFAAPAQAWISSCAPWTTSPIFLSHIFLSSIPSDKSLPPVDLVPFSTAPSLRRLLAGIISHPPLLAPLVPRQAPPPRKSNGPISRSSVRAMFLPMQRTLALRSSRPAPPSLRRGGRRHAALPRATPPTSRFLCSNGSPHLTPRASGTGLNRINPN